MKQASIFVLVEDSACKPIESASVTLRAAARKPGITLKEGSLGNYSAIGVEPGSYVLEVSKQVYLRASYEITLNEGRNSTQVVLGKRGQPFFYAAGRKRSADRQDGAGRGAAKGHGGWSNRRCPSGGRFENREQGIKELS